MFLNQMTSIFFFRFCVVTTVFLAFVVIFKTNFINILMVPSTKKNIYSFEASSNHNKPIHWDGGHNTFRRKKMGKCQPVHQVLFIKVHKAGSSTVMNIIARFGVSNDLVFALPRKQNYINRLAHVNTSIFLPPPPGRKYDVLCNHAVYNRTVFRPLFPNSTMYLGILREPFHQFISAFRYYGISKRVGGSQPVQMFLTHPDKYKFPKGLNFVRNRMIFDFGLDSKYFLDDKKIDEHIKMIERDFDLILILEYFTESLVLLRRRFCWTIKDVLSVPQNTRRRPFYYVYSLQDHNLHKNISKADYMLYGHFLEIFWRYIFEYGPDFFQEVIYLRNVIERVQTFCTIDKISTPEQRLLVPGSKWNSPFEVTSSDCKLIKMPEMKMMSLLRRLHAAQHNNKLSIPW